MPDRAFHPAFEYETMKLQLRVLGRAAAWLATAIAVACVSVGKVGAAIPGDTFEDPFPVHALPFLASGTTCGFEDDNLFFCSSFPSGVPDVVYRYIPDHDMTVTISTCGSSFWGSFMVYDAARTILVCAPTRCLYGAFASDIHLIGGSTYYVVIDDEGSTRCGEYILSIDECTGACQPVYVRCPATAIQEGENSCAPGYVDDFNGGCVGAACHATHIPCIGTDVTVCGTTGNYPASDLDAYEFELSAASQVTIMVSGGRASLLCELFRLVNGTLPGEIVDVQRVQQGIAFDKIMLDAGRYWLRLQTDEHTRIPCDNQYMVQLSGLDCVSTPAQQMSWGGLKSMYR